SAFLFRSPDQDPFERQIQRLIDESRPPMVRFALLAWRWLMAIYAVNIAVCLAVMPLVAHRFNVISPIALLLGPPMVLFTSIALMSGFMILFWAVLFRLSRPSPVGSQPAVSQHVSSSSTWESPCPGPTPMSPMCRSGGSSSSMSAFLFF